MRVFLFLLLLTGCPGSTCPVQQHTDPARALRMHRSLRRTVTAVRAEARVDQRGEQGRVRGTVLMFLQLPNQVRFDVMTQLGPAAILTSDGSQFQLLNHQDGRFQEGPSCPENIGRLLGIAMSGEELGRFLMGDTPRLEAEDVAMSCDGGEYLVVRTATDGRRQEIALRARDGDDEAPPEEQHLRLIRSELFHADGRTDWRATYSDYELVTDPADEAGRGVAFPHRIHFEDPDRNADTLIRVEGIELVPDGVPIETFQQTAPGGMSVEPISC